MKRFIFQFASVLNVRKLREDDALRGLGAAQRALKEALDERDEQVSQMEKALGRREALGKAPTTSNMIRLEQDFIDGQKRRIVRQEQIILRAQRSVEKAFRTYLSARRQTQTLEKLREQHLARFKAALAKKEQRELDDLSIMRARMVADERAESAEGELSSENQPIEPLAEKPPEGVK